MRQLVDDNGNITYWTYDSLNRQTVMTFPDGSTRTSVYNQASDVVLYTDENGSEFTSTFDAVGRKTAVSISLASGVIGTTAQSFQYDGLSRTTFARDTVSATHADVTMIYDSLSRVLEDSQAFDGNTRSVTSEAFTSYPMTQFAFPNGRQLTNTFDALYRRTEVANTGGSSIAKWQFFGTNRVAEVELRNGLIQTCMNNSRTRSARQEGIASPTWGNQSSDRLGYDGAGRMITKRYLAGGINGTTHAYNNTSAIVGQTTEFDKGRNKLYERELHAESRSHLYEPFDDQVPLGGYDSLDRLRQYQRGVLSSTGGQGNAGGGWITSPIGLPGTDEARTYDLDGLGNWHRTVFTPVGDSKVDELRQHNGLNQITTVNDGGGNVPFSYDLNGNLVSDDILACEWDARNRLKNVYKGHDTTPILIASYDYDALNRRTRKTVSNGGLSGAITNGTTDFIYNTAWQCVEERNGSNQPTKQYIWGIYIDELLQQRNDPSGTPVDLYPFQDLLYRTTALTDDSGDIVEAYDCDAYGNTLIFTAAGTGGNWWADDASQTDEATCDFIYTGARFDVESTLYLFRFRYYAAGLGRFISRDPLGQLAGPNCYAFVDSQPVDRTDPAGLAPIPGQKWFDENISPYLSESQKKKFQRIFDNGCIGVTLTLLGSLRSHPDLTNCYLELREAKAAQDYLDQREHCCLRNRNRRTLYNTVPRARIFNVQFSDVIVTGWKWDDAEEKHVPDTFGHTRIDPVSPEATRYDLNKHWGLIATSDPRYRTVNFDFLIYVEHMDFWIHANHSAPGMEVKYSTTKQAAEQFQNYRGFNRSFFCVACEATWSFAPPPKVDNDGWRPARPRTSPGGLPRTYPGS